MRICTNCGTVQIYEKDIVGKSCCHAPNTLTQTQFIELFFSIKKSNEYLREEIVRLSLQNTPKRKPSKRVS